MKLSAFAPYKKIISIILFPILFILFSIAINVSLSYVNYSKIMKDALSSKLNSIFTANESNLKSIADGIDLLELNKNITHYLSDTAVTLDPDTSADVSGILSTFAKNYDYIDSVALVNRPNQLVITNSGNYEFQNYFENIYPYANYAPAFWKSFKLYGLSPYQIQPPSKVTIKNSEKYIIPYVFCEIGNIVTSNYIIVNLDVQKMLADINSQSGNTQEITMGITNKLTGESFTMNQDSPDRDNILHSDFYEKLVSGESNTFNIKLNGQKMYVVTFSPSQSILGYCYYAAIPLRNIYATASTIINTMLNILFMLVVLFSMILSWRNIIIPLRRLETVFGIKPNSEKTNIFRLLQTAGTNIWNENIQLKHKYLSAFPFIQEKQLITLLNGNGCIEELYAKTDIRFKYDYFACVIINLHITTKNFINSNMPGSAESLCTAFYNTVEDVFRSIFTIHTLTMSNSAICIIINAETPSAETKLIDTITEISDMLSVDQSMIELSIGYGGIYRDITGLKRAYDQAVSSVSIKLGQNNSNSDNIHYYYTETDSDKLYDAIISEDFSSAKAQVSEIMEHNTDAGISVQSEKILYTNILNTICAAMYAKNLIDADSSSNTFINLFRWNNDRIKEEIFFRLNSLSAGTKETRNANNINNIVLYINNNYNKELSLDLIADIFNMKPKLISKQFKEKVGIGFSEYLAETRITAAKEFLVNSSLSLPEIYVKIGFNNKTTFIRTFKKIAGITPTEYRNTYKT